MYSLIHETRTVECGKVQTERWSGSKIADDIQPMPVKVLVYNLVER